MKTEKTQLQKDQLEEALKRLVVLKVMGVVRQQLRSGTLTRSEDMGGMFKGILYWLDDEENRLVKKFEDETGSLVYHVILQHWEDGPVYALLFVSKDKKEWETDIKELGTGEVYTYCVNGDQSEYGPIGIAPANGGVTRTW